MTDTTAPASYEITVGGDEGTLDLPSGTSLLVLAPLPAGRELVVQAIGDGIRADEAGLLMTTDEPASSLITAVRNEHGTQHTDGTNDIEALGNQLRIIDCQTDDITVGDENSITVQNVNTPRNLTDIGIGFKNVFDEFEATGQDRVRFGLLSLSVILSYVDRETVYRFCKTLTRGLAREGAVGLFQLTPEAHDDRTVNTLKRAFDGTLEITEKEGARTVKVTGLDESEDD